MTKTDQHTVANKRQNPPEEHEPPSDGVDSHATSTEQDGGYPQLVYESKSMSSDAFPESPLDQVHPGVTSLPAEQPKVQVTVTVTYPQPSNSGDKPSTAPAEASPPAQDTTSIQSTGNTNQNSDKCDCCCIL